MLTSLCSFVFHWFSRDITFCLFIFFLTKKAQKFKKIGYCGLNKLNLVINVGTTCQMESRHTALAHIPESNYLVFGVWVSLNA